MRRRIAVIVVVVLILASAVVQAVSVVNGHVDACRRVDTLDTAIQQIVIQSRQVTISLKKDYLRQPDGMHEYDVALALFASELQRLQSARC